MGGAQAGFVEDSPQTKLLSDDFSLQCWPCVHPLSRLSNYTPNNHCPLQENAAATNSRLLLNAGAGCRGRTPSDHWPFIMICPRFFPHHFAHSCVARQGVHQQVLAPAQLVRHKMPHISVSCDGCEAHRPIVLHGGSSTSGLSSPSPLQGVNYKELPGTSRHFKDFQYFSRNGKKLQKFQSISKNSKELQRISRNYKEFKRIALGREEAARVMDIK